MLKTPFQVQQPLRIVLVRHGESEHNVADCMSGYADTPLSENGIVQASAVAERLKCEQFTHAYTSDLSRAKSTAEAILRHHTCQLEVQERVRERCFGAFEGRAAKLYYEDRGRWTGLLKDYTPPEGGESLHMLRERVAPFVSDVIRSHGEAGGTILIAAHGSFNCTFTQVLFDLDYQERSHLTQGNTCVNQFELYPDRGVCLVCFNCQEHLEKS